MNAIKMLKEDHRKVKGLFREFEKSKDLQAKEELAEKIFKELEVHTAIEEEYFYPAIDARADKDGRKLVSEAIEEHKLVKDIMDELKQMKAEGENFDLKFKVLIENVEQHIEEEELKLFPEAKEDLMGELEEISQNMEERKEELSAIN